MSVPPHPHIPRSFFVTTAIDYTNGAPHIGHAYEKVLADVIARYHRLAGDHVFFLTGVDQHGQKVQQSAEKQGVAPQEFVDSITAKFVALWKKLGVEYDGWAATTDERHKQCVRAILQRLWDEKDPATGESRWIYKASQGGYYSVRQEQFLTDKERGPDGEFGPEWGQVEFREEENYYFRLTAHKQWLLDLIDRRSGAGKPFVVPEFRVAELRNAVEKIEGDLCITRPKARLSWGIEVPFDPGFVTFVWFDALVNYISFAPGYDPRAASRDPEFQALWPAVHVIGKDILIPAHGVYWPIMLKALGFADGEMPTLLVHGWWNIAGSKMSKTIGNIVDPGALADWVRGQVEKELIKQKEKDAKKGKPALSDAEVAEISDRCGAETVRYYLTSDITTGRDADFSETRLCGQYNTDLANGLGNLTNRTLNMVNLYRDGALKRPALDDGAHPPATPSGIDDRLKMIRVSIGKDCRPAYEAAMQAFQIEKAISEVLAYASQADSLIENAAPWKLVKLPEKAEELDNVLYHLAEALRIIAVLISPVLPKAADAIFDQLNWKMGQSGKASRFQLSDVKWSGETGLPDGHVVGKPVVIFPRIEAPKE
jgi:methionyl-tRNA synthetase